MSLRPRPMPLRPKKKKASERKTAALSKGDLPSKKMAPKPKPNPQPQSQPKPKPAQASAKPKPAMAPAKQKSAKKKSDYGARIVAALTDGKSLPSICRYDIVRELGEGGMGAVFLADQVSENDIRKPVAIKVLKAGRDSAALDKFMDEAKILARLSQGTIVELIALESMELNLSGGPVGKKSKHFFMVLEFVDGPSFEVVVKKHQENHFLMHPAMVGFVLNKAVIALAEAHTLTDASGANLGLIHRDISPGNILIAAKAGITKLADFGVARAFGDFDGDTTREIVGKPRFMAPEQLEGYAEAASDIWAFGIIGYESLTGWSPYRLFGNTNKEKIDSIKRQQSEFKLREPKDILARRDGFFKLEALSDIIMKCLSFDPKERPKAEELSKMLEGGYLYASGLGPTNKTLAAYMRLLDCAVGPGEIIPPGDYDQSEDARTLCMTLHTETAVEAFGKRSTAAYTPHFLKALKLKEPNPCLLPGENGIYQPA